MRGEGGKEGEGEIYSEKSHGSEVGSSALSVEGLTSKKLS